MDNSIYLFRRRIPSKSIYDTCGKRKYIFIKVFYGNIVGIFSKYIGFQLLKTCSWERRIVKNEKTGFGNYGSRDGQPLWRLETD